MTPRTWMLAVLAAVVIGPLAPRRAEA